VFVGHELVTYLDAVDGEFAPYLDESGNLSGETLRRLHRFAVAMAEGSMTAGLALDDWADFYPLAAAFVVVCGSDELSDLYDQATVFSAVVRGEVAFTDADRVFLVMLADELERYEDTKPEDTKAEV